MSTQRSEVRSVPSENAVLIAGRYRVLRLLGQGGMGAVYAVQDQSSGRELALKRLTSGASAATAALFEREYHTLAGLRHPNIVEVYEYGREQSDLFYTMELIDGIDLSKQAPMSWRDACRDLRDAASILGLLHARQLAHRDLSPRNLLRSKNGRLKLIDFGALAKFGPASELVGTPPFVAPEALRGAALDQRTDLYALGALAYWLVTGVHAYAARSLGDLPHLWQTELVPPSELLAVRESKLLEPIPPELDALILALLRLPPEERPNNTGELIDQLNAVAGLEPEAEATAVQGYLDSKSFVGRTRERERALALLNEASTGTTRTLLIEGDAGVGRTRFIEELAVMARLGGALVLVADQSLGARPYGVAERLLLELLRTLPEQTHAAIADHGTLLGGLSKELRAELRVTARPSLAVQGAADTRVRLLNALRDVFVSLSRERLLALLVDDVQAIDDESQALLAALAHSDGGHKLLIVASLGREQRRDSSAAVTSLRGQATRLRLLPLSVSETLELLRSVFGEAPYLSRLAERLHRLSEGNPAYCLELAAHLVQTGAAKYQEGTWSLPVELAPESLPASRQAAQVARLERLSSEARALARSLSVPHSGLLTVGQCYTVCALPPMQVHELLAELVREDVLRPTADGHRFVHGGVRVALYEELDAEGRKLAHLQLGAELVNAIGGSDDVLGELRACTHFMRGGDAVRAYERQAKVVAFYERGDVSSLNITAPLLADLYALHRERGTDKYGLVGILGLLGIAGYFADRRYATQFGDLAIDMLRDVLRLELAGRLGRFLGKKLGLLVALAVAGVSLRLRARRAPNVAQLARQMMGAAAALSGTAVTCVDFEKMNGYASVLEPFAALGKDHAASFTHRFAGLGMSHMQGHLSEGERQIDVFIEQLESPRPIRDLPHGVKINYLAGAVFMRGYIQSLSDGPECLATADKLEQYGPVFAMSADFLRASHHAGQGNTKLAAHFRERMEVHAVQLGSAWQVETWAPYDTIKVALRTQDASLMKRAVQELGRLIGELPSFALTERHARGLYLVQRHKYRDAIPLLDSDESPHLQGGWARVRGLLARAYNELGEHARAKEICLHAIASIAADDLRYTLMTLDVQLELALAESGLGNFAVARHQLDKLFARHAPANSAITLGALHHTRARVALAERDYASAREHLAKMDEHYRGTGVATLIALIGPLRRDIDRSENPRSTGPDNDVLADRVQHVMLRVQLLLSDHGDALVTERAQRGLQIALELSSADEGFIMMAHHEGDPVAHLGSGAPSTELVQWAQQNMLDAGVDEQTVMTEEVHSEIDSNYKVVGQMRYCVVPLWARQGRDDNVVAALVLGFDNRVPRIPEPAVMRAIASHLADQA